MQTTANNRAVLIGIGAIALAPILIPAVAKIGKPLLKAAVKGTLSFYEKSQIALSEAGEVLRDVVAESKAELTAEMQSRLLNGKE
ncbi:MAG TPA: DUF5132 domain-containing protein [Cyanobacteria bacterium UBA11162]|nr:DUF5132 domain-containing protein [Cyanobacteria bacterium UBA12227]HAX85146.1 DUF5132 domain-containing protein [Cyanobacteria bacterium UBA11370]HBL13245.1 DUF5132 domain-containing protein [Cyanobacteria bacterium UBA11162]HBY77681.1 DUF5132 domain-containing protein [Cyanobacteria bacterium UBA11148]